MAIAIFCLEDLLLRAGDVERNMGLPKNASGLKQAKLSAPHQTLSSPAACTGETQNKLVILNMGRFPFVKRKLFFITIFFLL